MDDGNNEAQALCPFCQAELIPRKVFSPGDNIAGFTIIRELGHGGMGVVYLAEQTSLNRQVALKVLEEALAGDHEFVQSFFREANAAAKLAHPNIVQAFDAGIDNGICYFVMELIQGQNLDDYVAQNGPMQIGLLLNVAVYVADALTYAWERNHLSHGDIKPENIIMQNNGEIKLADLGLARDHQYDTLVPGEIMATPAYAPPEVIRGEINRITFKADMYSFGTTLYHLATGAPPFPDDDPKVVCTKQLNNQPKPLIAIDCNIPEDLSALVDQLMEKSPDHRPYSWAFVTQQLMAIRREWNQKRSFTVNKTETETDITPAAEPVNPAGKIRNYKWVIAALTAMVFFLSGIVLFLYITGYFQPDNASDSSGTDSINTVAGQWKKLKLEIRTISAHDALRNIERFIAVYKTDVPAEALAMQESYRNHVRFEKRVTAFREYKTALFIDLNKKKGCLPGEHPLVAREQLFALAVLTRQQNLILLYARQLEHTFSLEDLFTEKELQQLQRYRAALEKRIEKYSAAAEKYPRSVQIKYAEQEARFLLRKLSCCRSSSAIRSFINEYRDFKKYRLHWLATKNKKIFQTLAPVLKPEHFVTDSQYLINMKKYLIGRMITPHWKITAIRENGILCSKVKQKTEKIISWSELYDLWNNPIHELLLPTVPFMTEKDAISFLTRELIRRNSFQYYQDLAGIARQITPSNRKKFLDAAQLFLKQ